MTFCGYLINVNLPQVDLKIAGFHHTLNLLEVIKYYYSKVFQFVK